MTSEVSFLDRVDVWAVSSLILSRRRGLVKYFCPPPATRLGSTLLKTLGFLRVVGPASVVDSHVGQMRDADGRALLIRTLREAREITMAIKRDWIVRATVVAAFEPAWPRDVVAYHLERVVEADVRRECMRLRLASWMASSRGASACVFLSARPWASFLDTYAAGVGASVRWYRRPIEPWHILRVRRLFGVARLILGRMATADAARPTHPSETHPSDWRTGLRYGHRSLRAGELTRSELFWVAETARAGGLVIYDVTSTDASPAALDDLRSRGIRVFGTAAGAEQWRAGGRARSVALRGLGRLAVAIVVAFIKGRRTSPWIIRTVADLCLEYGYWYEFFWAQRVLVHVAAWPTTSVAQVLALRDLGGVTTAYQHTASHLLAPAAFVSAGETVQFVFSEEYASMIRAAGTPTDRIVVVGFIYDLVLRHLSASERASELRRRLGASGARFLVCFFDENSADRWDIATSNAEATADYSFLLDWLAADPTLGLIVKVKKARDLRDRVSSVIGQLDEAVRVGRCVVVGDDTIVGSTYPAEVASAADISIGKLEGTTAALEARLAGIRTVLISSPHLEGHPLEEWLGPAVVFPTWEAARAAVRRHREHPASERALGEWSHAIERFDPYRDGRAAARMDRYVAALMNALSAGRHPSVAIAEADDALRRVGLQSDSGTLADN